MTFPAGTDYSSVPAPAVLPAGPFEVSNQAGEHSFNLFVFHTERFELNVRVSLASPIER